MTAVAPTSFSGPPMSMQRPVAYDAEDILPELEATGLDLEESHLPPSQRSRPTSSVRYQAEQQKLAQQSAHSAFRAQQQPEEKQSSSIIDHFPLPPATSQRSDSTNFTPRRWNQAQTPSEGFRVNTARRTGTPEDESRVDTARARTQQRGRTTSAPATTVRPRTSPHGQFVPVLDARPGTSSSMYGFGFPSPPISPTSMHSPSHRALLAAQADLFSQNSTAHSHTPLLGAFGVGKQGDWTDRTAAGREAAQREQQQRVDALIRLRMDQVNRARAHVGVNVLDSIYVNATQFFSDSPKSRPYMTQRPSTSSGGPSSPSTQRPSTSSGPLSPREASRQLFDPLAKLARVQWVHTRAREENNKLSQERAERQQQREAREKQMERQRLSELKRKRQEREKLHQQNQKIQDQRQARMVEQRKEEEAAQRAVEQQRQKDHARLVEQMKRYVPSAAVLAASPSRSDREREKQLEQQEAKEKEAEKWERVQREWRAQMAEQQAKREEKEKVEREKADAEAEEKHQRALEARRARDDRIIQYMLQMQDVARDKHAADEAKNQRAADAEQRRQKAHLQARDSQAEEARRKQAEKLQERQEEAERLMREQREKAAQLKALASKGYREAVRANSPKRKRSPGRTTEEQGSPSNVAEATGPE